MWKCFSSVLVNGIPSRNFEASRGLRQGDPLSPLLFLLVAETFEAMISKATEGGLIDGFTVGREEVIVSHLQYADDMLILCGTIQTQIHFLRCVPHCFERYLD